MGEAEALPGSAIFPAVDGGSIAPCAFDAGDEEADALTRSAR